MPSLSELNWLAIGVSTLLAAGLGAAWYSPALLGSAWMAELGKSEEELGAPGPAIGGSIVSCFVSALAVGLLATGLGVDSLLGGLGVGLLLGLGIVAMAMLSDSLFSGWGWRLYLIQTGYRVVYLALMGGIYGGWPS